MNREPELGAEGAITALVREGWDRLAAPSTFFSLLLIGLPLLAFTFWVSDAGDLWRTLGGVENPLLARFDTLLGLHAPWEAWWLVALGVATVLSAAAVLITRSPFWGTPKPEEEAVVRYPAGALSVRRVRAAAACLGESVRLAEGPGQLALLAPSRLHRAATFVLFTGTLLLSLGGVLASRGILLGEIVLSPGQPVAQMLTPGPGGKPLPRALPFSIEAVTVAASGSLAELVVREGRDEAGQAIGEGTQVTPRTPLRHGTTWITPRFTRRMDGGERFRLRLVGPGGDPVEALLVPREIVQAPGGGSIYRVRDFSEDLNGAGPAVWVEHLEGEKVLEGFWVFEKLPGFDRDNREDPVAIELLEIERASQLVAGVVHLAGILPLLLGGGLMLLGIVLLWIGVRRSRVALLGHEIAWGHPAHDPKVQGALAALNTGLEA